MPISKEPSHFLYAEEAANIVQILDFLNEVLEEDNPENEDGILEMKAVLEDWLDEIDLKARY